MKYKGQIDQKDGEIKDKIVKFKDTDKLLMENNPP